MRTSWHLAGQTLVWMRFSLILICTLFTYSYICKIDVHWLGFLVISINRQGKCQNNPFTPAFHRSSVFERPRFCGCVPLPSCSDNTLYHISYHSVSKVISTGETNSDAVILHFLWTNWQIRHLKLFYTFSSKTVKVYNRWGFSVARFMVQLARCVPYLSVGLTCLDYATVLEIPQWRKLNQNIVNCHQNCHL
jgi:hypothetical protein